MKHRIVTAAQMKEIERAGDAHGLSYLQMMENAGLAAYAELQKQFPHPGRLLVVCGKGNNGGDGFVIARAAAKDGWNVTVLLSEGEPKTADAIRNFERLHSLPRADAPSAQERCLCACRRPAQRHQYGYRGGCRGCCPCRSYRNLRQL